MSMRLHHIPRSPRPIQTRAALLALLLLLPCARLQAQPGFLPVDRAVAVTFDDLPVVGTGIDAAARAAITRRLLASFARHDVPVVGFVNEAKLYNGAWLDLGRVALLQQWLSAGHELGNHTFSHRSLHRTPLAAYQEDILRGEHVTRALVLAAGKPFRFFRHPYLHTGLALATRDSLETFLQQHGYRVAPVTIDNADWIFARAYDLAYVHGDSAAMQRVADAYIPYMTAKFAYYERQSRALFGYEIKQILLLHANRLNADTFDRLAGMMRGRGYRFIPLEEALMDTAYASADHYTGPGGISWLHRWAYTHGERGAFFEGEPEVPAFVMVAAGVTAVGVAAE